jgi:hypothetical protein
MKSKKKKKRLENGEEGVLRQDAKPQKNAQRDKERITYTYIYMIVWPLYDGGNNGFGCCFLNGTTMIEDENNCWRLFC